MDAIHTTDSELHDLWKVVHAARPSTANVTIPKEALRHLLTDHATLYTVLTERRQLHVTAGADQRSLL